MKGEGVKTFAQYSEHEVCFKMVQQSNILQNWFRNTIQETCLSHVTLHEEQTERSQSPNSENADDRESKVELFGQNQEVEDVEQTGSTVIVQYIQSEWINKIRATKPWSKIME